jgi:hypothetical protein
LVKEIQQEAVPASAVDSVADAQTPLQPSISLSFVHRYAGESGREYVNHWSVAHSPNDHWNRRVEAGAAFFAQLETLAFSDETAAHDAMRMAVLSPNWSSQGWGEESGFAWQMASAAIVGLRAIRAGWDRFQPVD